MLSLVPVWRADADSARRLYDLGAELADEDVVRAAEQVRFQACGSETLPLWLQALQGFASADDSGAVQWMEDADERAVLLALVARLDAAAPAPVLVFSAAQQLQKRLRLRCLLAGLSVSFVADWAARFRDGEQWQPAELAAEPESAAAILQLASGQPSFVPWGAPTSAAQARAQALGLLDLQQRGWL